MKAHKAPWGRSLVAVSALVCLLCLVMSFLLARHGVPWLAALVPVAVVLCATPFTIRGYSVSPDEVLVHRFGWTSRLPLAGLQSVEHVPDAMKGSIRTFGNGGLFSFTGLFRNRRLGSYRAFATDPHRSVVLRFPKRTVVVTPGVPEDFVAELAGRCEPAPTAAAPRPAG